MCQSMVNIQSPAAEIRRGKKKEGRRRRTNHSMKIYMVSLLHRATIIRQHSSTTYVDAAYCYRPSSVVCLSVTLVSSAKTAAPIDMPFGLRTAVGPRNHVLDGGPDPRGKGQFLRGERSVIL